LKASKERFIEFGVLVKVRQTSLGYEDSAWRLNDQRAMHRSRNAAKLRS
jgi:hypothetical protein